MAIDRTTYFHLSAELKDSNVTLVAVSKTKPPEDILSLYELGHRDFGENYVQELTDKVPQLPADINWHFIGHLQTNKVKLIASVVQLIHGVDSLRLLEEINKQAAKIGKVIDCLLQVHVATEETKFGFGKSELQQVTDMYATGKWPALRLRGIMGMASFSDDETQIRKEFRQLKQLFDQYGGSLTNFNILSMGMSGDYQIAISEGSNMVRIGSLLFGERIKG